MNYEIIFTPELQINTEDFVTAWNTDTACQAVALATIPRSMSQQFDVDQLAVALIIVSATIARELAMGVAGNALYDLIKSIILKLSSDKGQREIKIVEITQPDGTKMLVVTINER